MSKKPAFIAYTVRERGRNRDDYWARIGGAWPNSTGGFTIQLDALPLDGRIVLVEPKPDEAGPTADEHQPE